jgi:hypothetical protein
MKTLEAQFMTYHPSKTSGEHRVRKLSVGA